jgi:hypothetical protein
VALRGSCVIQGVSGGLVVADFALACEENPDLRVPVFSYDGHEIVVGLAHSCTCVGEEQLFAVLLDSGETVHCTTSTNFLMRRGGEKSPPELKVGDSLLPLYLGKDAQGYPTYMQLGESYKHAIAPADRVLRRRVMRLVAEWKHGHPLKEGARVELADGNPANCHPSNLTVKEDVRRATRSRTYSITDAVRRAQTFVEAAANRRARKNPKNHTVHDIQPMEMEPVYELSVEDSDIVAVEGVFLGLMGC